jgi:DNA-directed RNA polymerase subunit K/omega
MMNNGDFENKNVVEEEEEDDEGDEGASVADDEGAGEEEEGGASDAEASEAEASDPEDEEEAEASDPEASEAEASDPEEASEAEASEAEASEAEASDQEAPASGSDDDEESGTKKTKTKKTKNTKTKNSKNVSSISGVNMLPTAKPKTQTGKSAPPIMASDDDDDEYEEDEDDEFYLQKFDRELRDNFITDYHPESKAHNYEEVKALARVSRDGRGIINDPLHKTIPFLTKYEMTRVVGQRAKQLDNGAKPFVRVPPNIIDGYHIALLELEQKKIPFIIKRPYPNGGVEYWHVNDLELL